jgi:hypothetical protein
MPYAVVKVPGGFKVQNKKTKQVFSNHPMTKEMAERQKIALILSEKKILR